MAPQRPQRPTTRTPQPAGGKAPTSRQPAVRPPTQPIHKAPTTRMPTDSGRSSTRSVPRHGTSRGSTSAKSNLPLILGGAGGALLLISVLAVALSGGTKKEGPASNKKAAPKVMDLSGIETVAEAKCEEGMGVVQKCESLMTGRELTGPEKARLKGDLERGLSLLVEGMSGFDKANSMAGKTYDVVKYSKTIKAARMKLGELGNK